ncbi:MAG: Flp pilus assembly protein CpaB, partial [Proteobacteria bacterium]|nr:Flp pilus assembly protein CpaB [Pseudomonadota bacterium]
MRLAVVVVIAIAALFAGGVFYFLLQYMEGVERDAFEFAEASKPGIDAVEVLVADIDLPAGTEIVSTILDWQPWPDDSLGDGYVVYNEEDDDADQSSLEEPFYDQIVRRTILAGEPITQAKLFTREGSSFLSGMLAPGMRAVAIRVQEVSGVGGFILPGDRVDVIVSLKWKIDQDARKSGAPYIEFTSETIVQNARVMGIDQAFDDFEENVSKASAVTIEVTPKQAEIIAVAQSKGELTLSLRSLIPGLVGTIQGFTSDRETLFSMGGGFPATDRLAQPVVVANSEAGGGASSDARPLPGIQVFRAMTARRDLPRGTLLRESDVDWAALPEGFRPEEFVIQGREAVTPAFLTGVLLNAGVPAGKPLPLRDLFLNDNAEFLGLALRPGMRAIKVDVVKDTFAGTPGDEVDVVLIGNLDDAQQFSETIIQKLRVLSIDAAKNGAVVEVTPKQFETLAL